MERASCQDRFVSDGLDIGQSRDVFGDDVARVFKSDLQWVPLTSLPRLLQRKRRLQHASGQPLHSCFPRQRRFRHSARLEWLVNLLEHVHGLGRIDLHAKSVRQVVALRQLLHDRLAFLFELIESLEFGVQLPELRVGQAARDLLSVSRDEGNGIAFIEQRHRRGNLDGRGRIEERLRCLLPRHLLDIDA